MRVTVMGQAAFGEAVYKRLREDGIELAGVSAPAPANPARPDALWALAESDGRPLVPTADLKDPAGLERWAAIDADLCVMAFVTEILPQEIFGLPRHGTIQYHPSVLPLHRGSSAINWAIINGDKATGLTVFWPDRGIDTGPILLTREVPLGPEDTVGSVYFERLFPAGVDALSEAVRLVGEGRAPRMEQDHAIATYEPPCGEKHAEIRWHAPASSISALIRGCNPQPGAWTTHAGEKLRIFDCRLLGAPEAGMTGRVLRIGEDGIDVRLNGDVLRIVRVQPAGGKKMTAAEWARDAGVEVGFRFR